MQRCGLSSLMVTQPSTDHNLLCVHKCACKYLPACILLCQTHRQRYTRASGCKCSGKNFFALVDVVTAFWNCRQRFKRRTGQFWDGVSVYERTLVWCADENKGTFHSRACQALLSIPSKLRSRQLQCSSVRCWLLCTITSFHWLLGSITSFVHVLLSGSFVHSWWLHLEPQTHPNEKAI